jgi:hypothetical protein
VTSLLLCPHNFVTYLTETLYIESYNCFVWKIFPILYIFLYCTVSNCYHASDISIIYWSGGGLCVYLSSWVALYVYSWIYIYRRWTNNGNIRQYWNKTVCVGCTLRTLVVSFVCLCCVVPVSVHCRLYLVTVCMGVLQNRRLLKFSKRTYCWCMFSWSVCNQNGHFVRCIQSSSFQSYDDIHKSWEDIIS